MQYVNMVNKLHIGIYTMAALAFITAVKNDSGSSSSVPFSKGEKLRNGYGFYKDGSLRERGSKSRRRDRD